MDQKELVRLVRMADRVEIAQVMAKFTQYFDQFNAKKIYDKLLAHDHPEVSVEFMECGLYEGPEKVRTYMEAVQKYLDDPSDKRGWMGLQNLGTPHIVVSTSGDRARGSWDMLNANAMQAAEYPADQRKLTALWVCGRYDNEFIRVDGEWKLLKVHLVTFFKSPFDQGWLKNSDALRPCGVGNMEPTRPSNPNKVYHSDATYSGEWLHNWGPYLPDEIDDGPCPEYTEDEATMERIERAAAVKEIERIQGRYLTLLDAFSMDRMCEELFAWEHPECCFTMCEGGDYIGPGMRAFVDACSGGGKEKKVKSKDEGNPMTVHGWFGMVGMWTPNVTLSKDGTRARAQWNVLAPHAMAVTPYPGDQRRPTGYWFLARYDNEYIKVDGEWKLLKNKVYSYARAPYDLGWVRQPDARRILHGYHNCGVDPVQPAYHPDNVYSGKGAHTWGPFPPDAGEF